MNECPWCHVAFEPRDANQRYCKRDHSRKSRTARKKASSECPRPDKAAYESSEPAEAHAQEIGHHNVKAYLCKCGKWHVGNVLPAQQEFIERVAKLQALYIDPNPYRSQS